jgi:hypothetical protein
MNKEFKEQKLIGQYFHTYELDDSTGRLEVYNQGCIEGNVTDEVYICQLFSFIDGSETNSIVVHVNNMKDWRFYKTKEDMQDHYNEYWLGYQSRLEESRRLLENS